MSKAYIQRVSSSGCPLHCEVISGRGAADYERSERVVHCLLDAVCASLLALHDSFTTVPVFN
eukprot:3706047-Amphidinium_carterae.1